jgi:DNA-binding IclR family transcriptional regulator
MSGLSRFVEILRLFDEGKSNWTIQEIAEVTNVPASTIYRTVRELVSQGFLDQSTEANYRLGAAFIEFDRRMRLTDPLIREGEPVLRDLVQAASIPAVAVLARLYRDEVICVADDRTSNSDIVTSYERGRPMPLLRGATSKTILAQLPRAKLRKIISVQENFDGSVDELAADLATIRKRGHVVTRGEVDTGLVGISAPVSCPDAAINASMSLIVKAADLDSSLERRLIMMLTPAASMLAERLAVIAK